MNLEASAILRGAVGASSYAEYYGVPSGSGRLKSRGTAPAVIGARDRGITQSKADGPALSRREAPKNLGWRQAAAKLWQPRDREKPDAAAPQSGSPAPGTSAARDFETSPAAGKRLSIKT